MILTQRQVMAIALAYVGDCVTQAELSSLPHNLLEKSISVLEEIVVNFENQNAKDIMLNLLETFDSIEDWRE